jgi:hypothetical protein
LEDEQTTSVELYLQYRWSVRDGDELPLPLPLPLLAMM